MAAMTRPNVFCLIKLLSKSTLHRASLTFTAVRYMKQFNNGHSDRWKSRTARELYKRRLEAGPDKERHRSEWLNWNYNAEIFAFGQRLGEEFDEDLLRRAFTHKSYIEKEQEKRAALGMTDDIVPLNLEDNEQLAHEGGATSSAYIKGFLRYSYPRLPEEGICAIHDHLISDEKLAKISRKIGTNDLILCEEMKPTPATLGKTMKAVIGALAQSQGLERTQLFIKDFVLTQLIGRDINALWNVVNPVGLLAKYLENMNRGPPEPRLIFQSGSETVMGVYMVGIYSDRMLLGQSPGESVSIAEEEAARDALKKIFGTEDFRKPMDFDTRQPIPLTLDKQNPSLMQS
ncbi:large ribosomal subunit protein mL44-like [Lineus longissimus]|uniref:large ribosomal subunit protein mL44-like n=1 Tax=Lineus longissimus TaxID=88925 RepID=UPI002B4F2595